MDGTDGQGNGKRFVLGVFEGFHLIELEDFSSKRRGPFLMEMETCLGGEKGEFSSDGDAMHAKQDGSTAHGDAGDKEISQGFVDATFVLAKAGGKGC